MRTRVFVSLLIIMPWTAVADSVRTLDGKLIDGKAVIDGAGVAVTAKGQKQPVKVPFSQLLRARFDGTDALDADTLERWNGLDIGQATQPGSHKQNRGQITVETAGADIAGRADSCRLVYQPVRGNGEISAKVTGAGQWRGKTAAGVMMRATSDAASQSVALLISRDSGLYLSARGNAGNEAVITQIGRMRTPLFLRLVREGTYVKAYRSADGKTWIKVGEARTNLGSEALAGVVAASREAGMSAPVFDDLRVGSDDVPGSTSTDLAQVRSRSTGKGKGRKDHLKRINVNSAVVLHALADDATFETRYDLEGKYNMLSGQAYISDQVKGGGGATFQIFGDDDKLFDSGKLSAPTEATSSFHVSVSGRRELKIVVIDNGGGKLFNSGGIRSAVLQAFKPMPPVPKSQFAQVVTTDGAVYAGAEIRDLSGETVEFSLGQRRDLSVPTERVARVVMPGFSHDMADRIPASGSGVMLTNGDFYEGDVEKLDGAKVQVNSVIFGPREFKVRGGDLQAIILRPVTVDPQHATAFEVTTADGSLLPAASLSSENNQLAVNDRHLGKLLVDARRVREIRYGGDRLKWVADLRPRRVSPAAGRPAAESFVIDATPLGPSLRLLDIDYERGVSLATGTAVTYDIDGRYDKLLCVGGVPADVLPTAAVVFVVEVDGKEAFRSPPRSSVQDPLPITVDTTGVKLLTLRVESPSGTALPAVALWADPLLIKSGP